MVSRLDGNSRSIAALDEQAETLGLTRGMGIADARAMYPQIDVAEAEPKAERRLLEGLADWCDRYTPLVALDGTDGLFLDITGCAHLFGGEEAMLDALAARLFQQGFRVRAGIAATAGAAWAAARFSGNRLVATGQEEACLAPLPLSALRLAPATRESLESVGLRTVGAVMAVPRAPLARRFGVALLQRLDQALGRLDEAVSPRLPVPPLSVERQLAEPITLLDDIERLTKSLSQALKPDLERRGEGARRLALALFRVDGAVSRIAVGTSRPLRDPVLIQKLFHERLAALERDIDPGFGFELVRLSVVSAVAFSMRQADLADDSSEKGADLDLFADRVRARLGEGSVLRPVIVGSHVPERAVSLAPFAQTPMGRLKEDTPAAVRPIRLFRLPEPVDVPATELPEGPPLRFRWRRAVYRVTRAEGPERIAPEWWRAVADQTGAATRDYFRVEDSEGRRFWLYRQGLYDAAQMAPRWFMHGIFA